MKDTLVSIGPWSSGVNKVPSGCLQVKGGCSSQVKLPVFRSILETDSFHVDPHKGISPLADLFDTKVSAILPELYMSNERLPNSR